MILKFVLTDSVVKSSIFQLRKLSKLKTILSNKDLESVIHAFLSLRLNYCNALYIGLYYSLVSVFKLFRRLQQDILINTRKRDHITPVLVSLHWLAVEYGTQYEV